MSVKQHLDESRDPSIASIRSESQYSRSCSNPSTPEAVDDLSPRSSPTATSPVTPLIFRTHFISAPGRIGSELSLGPDQDVEEEPKVSQSEQDASIPAEGALGLTLVAPAFLRAIAGKQDLQVALNESNTEEDEDEEEEEEEEEDTSDEEGNDDSPVGSSDGRGDSLGPDSPAALALADFFRLREQISTTPPQTTLAAAPQPVVPTLLLPPSACEDGGAPALLSAAHITDGQQSAADQDGKGADGDGPWWMLNDSWASWGPEDLPSGEESARKLSAGQVSPKTLPLTDMHVEETPVRVTSSEKQETDSSFVTPITKAFVTPERSSERCSPTSIIIAAQRKAWIAHFYPDSDISKRPYRVQLSKLQLPSLDDIDAPSAPQHPGDGSPRRIAKAGLELGSPFRGLTSELSKAEATVPAAMPDCAADDEVKENRTPLPPKPKYRARAPSFGINRASRHRAASTAAPPPPPLILADSTFSPHVKRRARANSDTSLPSAAKANSDHAAFDNMFKHVGSVNVKVGTDTFVVVKSILDEQVFTPVWPTTATSGVGIALMGSIAPHLQSFHNYPITGRPRSQTGADRVTFAQSPLHPVHAPALPTRSHSTGSSIRLSAAARLSRLLRGRLQNQDAARAVVAQDPFVCKPAAAETPHPAAGSYSTGKGWSSARCSLDEWEMSPYSPETSRHLRLRSCTAGADTDPDGDARTECSTAPSTPTIPAHMLSMSPWESSEGSCALSASPESLTAQMRLGKPLPLPCVDSTAALRLRPSASDLRQQADFTGHGVSASPGHTALVTEKSGSGAISLPFHELKAGWEARTRHLALITDGGPPVSSCPAVSRFGSPRLGAPFGA